MTENNKTPSFSPRAEFEALPISQVKELPKIDIIKLARENLPKCCKMRTDSEIRQILLDMHDLVEGV